MTLAEALERAAGLETIDALVIGEWPFGGPLPAEAADVPTGELLDWATARSMLDYEWDSSFGGPKCHPLYAWTPTRVLSVVEYDGSTALTAVPREPTPGTPTFAGYDDLASWRADSWDVET